MGQPPCGVAYVVVNEWWIRFVHRCVIIWLARDGIIIISVGVNERGLLVLRRGV